MNNESIIWFLSGLALIELFIIALFCKFGFRSCTKQHLAHAPVFRSTDMTFQVSVEQVREHLSKVDLMFENDRLKKQLTSIQKAAKI